MFFEVNGEPVEMVLIAEPSQFESDDMKCGGDWFFEILSTRRLQME